MALKNRALYCSITNLWSLKIMRQGLKKALMRLVLTRNAFSCLSPISFSNSSTIRGRNFSSLFFFYSRKGQMKCNRNLMTPGAAVVKRKAQALEHTLNLWGHCEKCHFFLVQLQLIGALLLFPGPAGLPFPTCWALWQVSFKGMNSNLINGKQFSFKESKNPKAQPTNCSYISLKMNTFITENLKKVMQRNLTAFHS